MKKDAWPACVAGHRLMLKALTRDGYVCPECGWFLPTVEWLRYLR